METQEGLDIFSHEAHLTGDTDTKASSPAGAGGGIASIGRRHCPAGGGMGRKLSLVWRSALDIVMPRLCRCCGRRLQLQEDVFCTACVFSLPLTGQETRPDKNELKDKIERQHAVERAAALIYFQPHTDLAQAVYDMKYRDVPTVADWFGATIGGVFAEAGFFDAIDVIVPVPITPMRRFRRGYNQSEILAGGIARVAGLPVDTSALRRRKFAKSQTTLHGAARENNVAKAFKLVNARPIAGRHVLLVDDIVTTGATVRACIARLIEGGAAKVSVACLGMARG